MNLLVVHEVNYLEKIIYEFQILPETLSILGHNVTVIDYDDTWNVGSKAKRSHLRPKVFANTHRAYPQASVTVRRPGMFCAPGVSRVTAAATTAIEVIRVLKTQSIDAVLLYGLPTVGVQTVLAARYFKVPVIFRSIDILNQLAPPSLQAATRLLERSVYRRVARTLCVTPHLKQYVKSFGVPDRLIDVLPSGVDAEMFSPGPREASFLERWKIAPTDPIILFMGTLYKFSGLDRVITDFPDLISKVPTVKLVITGVGEDEERLKSMVTNLGLAEHVIFTGFQQYGSLPTLIRSADICINPFELNDITRDILPTKLFQYLACGKPVVATELPGTIPFLSGPQHGVVYASQKQFVATLGDLLGRPSRLSELAANAVEVTRRDYHWTSIALKLVSLIEQQIN